jgi:hypothetical protein
MLPQLTVQQREQLCNCGRRLAWWTITDARCCRCMRLPDDCQCPATNDPAESCLGLDLERIRGGIVKFCGSPVSA